LERITACYVRVSSRDQSHASQLPDLERWVAAHEEKAEWFKDTFSGKTLERPGLERLLEATRAGKVGKIVIWRLDRLGRTARGLTGLFEELCERGVGLVSLKDGLDLGTAAGRLMANVLASVAAYETEIRAERVAAGQAVARRRGKKWGGSKKGWHYRVKPEHVVAVKEMKASGKPVTHIATVTGLSRPTIYAILADV
jgi:DNA invertase Pin-like site-specific DNA recombinase